MVAVAASGEVNASAIVPADMKQLGAVPDGAALSIPWQKFRVPMNLVGVLIAPCVRYHVA